MKIELEVTAEQLNELDKGLNNLLLNLTEQQQVELIQGYLNKQFQDIYKEETYYSSEILSDFGKNLVQNLQAQISHSITSEIINNENVKKEINKITQNVLQDLPDIIPNAITEYIVRNLFQNKGEITTMIQNTYWNNRNRERNGNY